MALVTVDVPATTSTTIDPVPGEESSFFAGMLGDVTINNRATKEIFARCSGWFSGHDGGSTCAVVEGELFHEFLRCSSIHVRASASDSTIMIGESVGTNLRTLLAR